MKTKLLTALVVLGSAVGCVAVDTPVDIGNAKPLNAACERDDGISQGGGMLNVAAFISGERPAYHIAFDVISTLQPVEVSSSTGTITDATQTEAVVEEIRYTYASKPDIGLRGVNDPAYFVVSPGTEDSWMAMNLFPGDAGDMLAASVVPGERVQITVGVQLVGKLRSGSPFATAIANFPVMVENVPCPNGGVGAIGVGPCGLPGQDGAFGACCPADNRACLAGATGG